MDFDLMLADLRAEVTRLNQAIEVLESLQRDAPAKRRGRPRKWPLDARVTGDSSKGSDNDPEVEAKQLPRPAQK